MFKRFRNNKTYQSKWMNFMVLGMLITTIFYIPMYFLSESEILRLTILLIFLPVITNMVNKFVEKRLDINLSVDIKIYDYKQALDLGVEISWTAQEFIVEPRENLAFVEIENIGDAFLSKIKIVPNHNNKKGNEIFDVPFPLPKGEKLYFVLPISYLQHEESSLSIICYSYGIDDAKRFSAPIIDLGRYKTFSKISFSCELKEKKEDKRECVRIAFKQVQDTQLCYTLA